MLKHERARAGVEAAHHPERPAEPRALLVRLALLRFGAARILLREGAKVDEDRNVFGGHAQKSTERAEVKALRVRMERREPPVAQHAHASVTQLLERLPRGNEEVGR